MREYQLYLFDFDGTITDSFLGLVDVYREGLRRVGRTCSVEDADHFMHQSLQDTGKDLNFTEEEFQAFLDGCADAMDAPSTLAKISLYEDVIPVIKALHEEGKIIGVVSGNTEYHIRNVLHLNGIEGYFSIVVGADKNRRGKPYPDVIYAVRDAFPEIKPEEMVYIGDSLQDPETAIAGGISGILLERNGEYPDYIGEKVSSLRELLKKQNAIDK